MMKFGGGFCIFELSTPAGEHCRPLYCRAVFVYIEFKSCFVESVMFEVRKFMGCFSN